MLRRYAFALRPLAVTSLALCALTLNACDDGGEDATDFSSGLEGEKKVSGLTDAEGQQFCDAAAASFGNLVSTRKACELTSVFFTEDAATCRAFTDQCVQAPPEPEAEPDDFPEEEDDCTMADAEKRMGCDETVATLEACMGTLRGLTVETLGRISCSDAGNAEGLQSKFADLPMGLAEVPGCESLAANCPELFPEDDEPMDFSMQSMDQPADPE